MTTPLLIINTSFLFFLQINVLQAKKKFEILDAVSRYFILLI